LQADEVSSILIWAQHLYTERLRDLQQALRAGENAANPQRIRLDTEAGWLKHRKHPGLFSWRGRTASSARAAALRYHRQVRLIREAHLARQTELRGRTTWDNKGTDYVFEHGEDSWTITELCSLQELIDEGSALAHCVATYARRCVAEKSAILSLRRNGQRRITIELDCRTGGVVQARGMSNRGATPTEREIINMWVRQCIQMDVRWQG